MLRRLAGIVCLLAITCGCLPGCASGFGNKSKFGRGEQWEPDVEEASTKDWRSTPSGLRNDSDRKSSEDPIDRMVWSKQSLDINRSLGGSL